MTTNLLPSSDRFATIAGELFFRESWGEAGCSRGSSLGSSHSSPRTEHTPEIRPYPENRQSLFKTQTGRHHTPARWILTCLAQEFAAQSRSPTNDFGDAFHSQSSQALHLKKMPRLQGCCRRVLFRFRPHIPTHSRTWSSNNGKRRITPLRRSDRWPWDSSTGPTFFSRALN